MNQYARDAAALGGVEVKGQNNFDCILEKGLTADEGPCHDGIPCGLKDYCPYRVQLSIATEASLVVTNYAYWLAQNNYATGLGDVDLIVCDEVHQAFGAMENYLTISLSRLDIQPMGITFPEAAEPKEQAQWTIWRSWADTASPVAGNTAASLDADIKQLIARKQTVPHHMSRSHRIAKSVSAKLKRMSAMGEDWVVQKTHHGYRFTPKWVANYSSHLFGDVPKVVLMSAILSHRTADYLGVPNGAQRSWVETESHFPPENTPIWHVPTTRINFRTDDYGAAIWCARVDQIIQRRLDRKGIVFTVSYDRARMLMARSNHKNIMIAHNTGDVVQVVDRFKRMAPPAVLLSPTVTTGWDFPGGGKSQYLVVGKIPYPDTRDPVTKARHEDDKEWTSFMAMETLVQECGRGTRGPEDKCEVVIIDDNWKWFYPRYRAFSPKWFQDRVKGSRDAVFDPLF